MRPIHKAVEAAERRDAFRSWTQHQVIGVAEDDPRAGRRHPQGEAGQVAGDQGEGDEDEQRRGRVDVGPDVARPEGLFTNLLLADEINRTPPKTQAALLQAMQEREGSAGDLVRPAGRYHGVAEEAYALLETLGLATDALRPVNELAYGRQRLADIAVSLGLKPKVLLLDEPAAGVPSGETGAIVDMIERLPKDIAFLIIEHDMDLVFRLADRITVLVQGSILVEGPPREIAADAQVRQVYLGERRPR